VNDVPQHTTHSAQQGTVLLRDVIEADLPTLFAHQFDPIANQLAAFPARDWHTFEPHWAKILRDDSVIKKTVLLDGDVVGNFVSFTRDAERLIGYWISRQHWGKRIATRALPQFLTHEKFRPLHARVAKHNPASIRVLQKSGFAIIAEGKFPFGAPGEEIEEFILALR
jgi:RimJ/RimL family protein N-acetyltransferase